MNDAWRNMLLTIPRGHDCAHLPVVIAIKCSDAKVRRRLLAFSKEVEAILHDPSSRSSVFEATGLSAETVLITAGGFAFAGGCDFTDNARSETWMDKAPKNAYLVRLVYKFNCGGVGIVRVGPLDSVLKEEAQSKLPPAIDKIGIPLRTRKRNTRKAKKRDDGNRKLFYRRIPHKPDFVIIADSSRASYVHQIWQAIKRAKTWKEFSAMLPSGEWTSLLKFMDEKPIGRSPFNAETLPGYSDGDYPPWLQTEIANILPPIVREEFSLKVDSVLNGPYTEIPAEIETALIDRLRSLGLFVEQREDLFFY